LLAIGDHPVQHLVDVILQRLSQQKANSRGSGSSGSLAVLLRQMLSRPATSNYRMDRSRVRVFAGCREVTPNTARISLDRRSANHGPTARWQKGLRPLSQACPSAALRIGSTFGGSTTNDVETGNLGNDLFIASNDSGVLGSGDGRNLQASDIVTVRISSRVPTN